MEKRHGQVALGGNYQGCRWCRGHRHYHGSLFPCEHYSKETLDKIAQLDRENRVNWSNPEFIKKRIDGGMPFEGIIIMQMFAGLR